MQRTAAAVRQSRSESSPAQSAAAAIAVRMNHFPRRRSREAEVTQSRKS